MCRRVLQPCDGAEGQVVRLFGVEPEQEWAGQGVGNERHADEAASEHGAGDTDNAGIVSNTFPP